MGGCCAVAVQGGHTIGIILIHGRTSLARMDIVIIQVEMLLVTNDCVGKQLATIILESVECSICLHMPSKDFRRQCHCTFLSLYLRACVCADMWTAAIASMMRVFIATAFLDMTYNFVL